MSFTAKRRFPYRFEKNGRLGKIYKLGNGTFKTYFRFAGEAISNTHAAFESAYKHLDGEFSKLDGDRENTLSLNALNSPVRVYSELEQLVLREGNGATLREAVSFFLAHHKNKRFEPKILTECIDTFVLHQRGNNISPSQIKTLEKHFRRFKKIFGTRKIHEITTLEVTNWLISRRDAKKGRLWSAKTRTSVLGSLVSLSLFARDTLKAIPDAGKTEFQKVRRPKKDEQGEVEIYTPGEMENLLLAAVENDVDLIPALIVGGFQGLRPAEFHAEGAKRRPLTWEAFIWNDNILHITGQKVRSKANRDIPLHAVTRTWLKPFRGRKGEIWNYKQSHSKKVIALRTKAGVGSIYDGLRHSYASYRIRHLKGNLPQLAQEMGNSPKEIINSYKRNVTDARADAWFSLKPPPDYSEKIKIALALR
jgi:integrase